MQYSKTVLANGLRVITVPMPGFESATIAVWVNTGSRNEDRKVNGISHFLEHMTFKGSKKRPTAKEISQAVDSIGGEFNASTSKEWTNFYIKVRVGAIETAFDVLSDMVLNPILDPEEITREKGVIVEEIAMYEDTPMARIGDIFEQLIFAGNSLGWDIAGSKKSVRSITKTDFVRYRKLHYYPENLIVTVAGGIKEKETVKLTEKYFSQLQTQFASQQTKVKSPTQNFKSFKENQNKPKLMLRSKKNEQAHLIMGFLGKEYGHSQRYVEAILSTILGGGMSSRMFLEVRERRGLAYAIRTSSDHYKDTGYLATYAGVDVKRVDEAIKVILAEYYKISKLKNQISKQELAKAKEFLKGHLALSLEDSKDVNGFFTIEELMKGKPRTPEEVFQALDAVTIDEVRQFAKSIFKPERLNLALIGPYDDPHRFQKILR